MRDSPAPPQPSLVRGGAVSTRTLIQMRHGGLGVRLACVQVMDNKTGRKKYMMRVEEIDPLGPAAQVVLWGFALFQSPPDDASAGKKRVG